MTPKLKDLSKAILGIVLVAAACGRENKANDASGNATNANPAGPSQVVVSAKQLRLLKVATTGTHRFHPDTEVIGTVSFAEDPMVLQAEATLLTAAAADRQMAKELDRATQLRLTNGVSERELEQAHSDAATARSNYLSARSAALNLGKTAQELDLLVNTGRLPSLTERSSKWVSLNVTELDSSKFRPGMQLDVVTSDLPGHVFAGRIANVYATVDPNSHRVTMRARVADAQDQLKPGMLVTGTIATGTPFDAPAIPETAVVREGDGTLTAWITRDNRRFSQRIVRTGMEQDRQVQIISGLKSGERVVTDGGIYLDNMLQAPSGD
jgi:cobalt-zinc-cadmium efflux system membrane fusion protein